MPPCEHRRVGAVLEVDGRRRILDLDETQQFNRFRAITPATTRAARVGFLIEAWIAQSAKRREFDTGADDEGARGDGPGCGNGRDDAGGAARAAGSDERCRCSDLCVGIRPD
jgi:hypothetical protein